LGHKILAPYGATILRCIILFGIAGIFADKVSPAVRKHYGRVIGNCEMHGFLISVIKLYNQLSFLEVSL
jgi:hypothetical protein